MVSIPKTNPAELPSHACKFQCPQIFYFDGMSLLLLQFRAERAEDMLAVECPVDCWVLPMTGCDANWRIALYRLLVQGFRRIQGACAIPISLGGLQPLRRRFFNGQPVWEAEGGAGRFLSTREGSYPLSAATRDWGGLSCGAQRRTRNSPRKRRGPFGIRGMMGLTEGGGLMTAGLLHNLGYG